MSSDIQVSTDGRKVTVGYERKVNLGNYESEATSIYITEHLADEGEVTALVDRVAPLLASEAKIIVWSALGLDWEMDESGQPQLTAPPVQVERIAAATPPPQVAPPVAPTPPPVQPMAPSPHGKPAATQGNYAAYPTFCKDCGGRDFYDNRSDVDGRIQQGLKIGPDWKCKACGKGQFRPGSFDYNQMVGQAPAAQAPPAPAVDPMEEPF